MATTSVPFKIGDFSLEGKTVLVTGGTGSFGKLFIAEILKNHKPRKVIVFSRDELKQFEMQQNPVYQHEAMRFFLGDVRDRDRLERAFNGVDVVIHAAALKQAPTAEYNPSEFIKTNIIGAMNVVDAAISCKVKRVVALSTDKASAPVTLYGATKLCSDKTFIAANSYSGAAGTKFSVVRYGNVMASRGSVIPLWMKQRTTGEITITEPRMTRFSLTIAEAATNVLTALRVMVGGELFVFKIPSYRLTDLARVVAPGAKVKIIGIRPGEKIHESMITSDEAPNTYDYDNFFIIHPSLPFWTYRPYIGGGKKVPDGFSYTSDNNTQWLSDADINQLVDEISNNAGTAFIK